MKNLICFLLINVITSAAFAQGSVEEESTVKASPTSETRILGEGNWRHDEGYHIYGSDKSGVDYYEDGDTSNPRKVLRADGTLVDAKHQPKTVASDSIEESSAFVRGERTRNTSEADRVRIAADIQRGERLSDDKNSYAFDSEELEQAIGDYKDKYGLEGEITAQDIELHASERQAVVDKYYEENPLLLQSTQLPSDDEIYDLAKKNEQRLSGDNQEQVIQAEEAIIKPEQTASANSGEYEIDLRELEDQLETSKNQDTPTQQTQETRSSNLASQDHQETIEFIGDEESIDQLAEQLGDEFEIDISDISQGEAALSGEFDIGEIDLDGFDAIASGNYEEVSVNNLESDIDAWKKEEEKRLAIEKERQRIAAIEYERQLALQRQRDEVARQKQLREHRAQQQALATQDPQAYTEQQQQKKSGGWLNSLAQGMQVLGAIVETKKAYDGIGSGGKQPRGSDQDRCLAVAQRAQASVSYDAGVEGAGIEMEKYKQTLRSAGCGHYLN